MKKHARLLSLLLTLTLLLSAAPLLTLSAEAKEYDLFQIPINRNIFYIGDTLKDPFYPESVIAFDGGPSIPLQGSVGYVIGSNGEEYGQDYIDYFNTHKAFVFYEEEDGGAGSSSKYHFRPYTPHPHDWEITENGNTLTVRCTASGLCDAGGPFEITVNAHSVTLPESPFNAVVSIPEGFKEATGLSVDGPFYNYKAPGEAAYQRNITPGTPKAGSYQAVISITTESNVVIQSEIVPGGTVTYSAYVDYQAIDPKQTAATGDGRPIELALFGLAAFTALAAAAFLLDRRFNIIR